MTVLTLSTKGGDKLAKHLREVQKKLEGASTVEMGFFPEDIHPKNNVPVATVAFENEYGVPEQNIPSRPFFRYTVRKNSAAWGDGLIAALKAVNYDASAAFEGMGQLMQMQLRQTIESWSSPMNTPFTVKMKGFNDPLVETGFMLDHVKYKVKE